ncbi:aquaporin-like protein, partial [Saccharata proteae CBS 121410]
PEERRAPRASMQSNRSGGASMRLRRSPTSRQRSGTLGRRPTGFTSARPADAQSVNGGFSVAGPADQPAANTHHPYVDPGYSQLNPAYEQPVNTRPVWGLAKPLPRVIRPGMVPTQSELNMNNPQAGQAAATKPDIVVDPDIEKGRVEPTLRLGKISSQIRGARETRENKFLKRVGTGLSTVGSNASPGGAGTAGGRVQTPQSPQPFSPGALEPHQEEIRLDAEEAGKAMREMERDQRERFPDDASSAATALDEEDQDAMYMDELALRPYGPEDEVHNHHTHWSVIRTQYREPLAEFLAVLVQLTLGFCADLAVVCGGTSTGNGTTTDFAWGFASMLGIYIAGGISGAHLNPAITIMLYIYRGFPARKMPAYILAQLLGAFCAGLLAFGIYRNSIINYSGSLGLAAGGTRDAFVTGLRHEWIDATTAFFTEFVGTAFLSIAVLALGDDTNAPPGAGMNAFIIGLVIYLLSNAFAFQTGAALNPSRDLGPRLALYAVGYGRGLWDENAYWFYGPWAGAVTGAVVGGGLYDVAIFVGGESPINYPRRRIRRAGHKWRKRWGARLR